MRRSRLQRLAPHLWRYRARFAAGAVALVATNVMAMRIPRHIGEAVQYLRDVQAGGRAMDMETIASAASAVALLALGAMAARVTSRVLVFNAGRLVEYDVRNELFRHLLALPTSYYQRQATGDLVSRIINDVTQIRLLFGVGVLNIVNTVLAYAVVLAFMVEVSPELTLATLAPYPVVLLCMRYFTKQLYVRTRRAQAQLSVVSSEAQECLSGAAVVQTFGIEAETAARFRAASDSYAERNIDIARIRGALIPFMTVVAGLGSAIVIGLGGREVLAGQITLGQFVEFSGYAAMLAWPTMALGWVLSVWNRGTAAFDRACDVLDTAPDIDDPDDPRPLPERGDIVFDDVSLTYEDGTRALSGVSLRIPAGATVAFVGPTGSGKTSLVELIPRLRDPTGGALSYGDVALPDARLEDVRARMAYAPQEGFLFSMSLAENIHYGREHDAERMARAVDAAHLVGDLPALSDGLDTVVGERGVTVSGGQRHRSTIARAIYADAEVLILDDALASVDTETEREILGKLREVLRGRTSLLVTHRFAALDLVDRIYVLEEGRLIEQGSYDELCAAGGRFAEMVEKQQLEEALA